MPKQSSLLIICLIFFKNMNVEHTFIFRIDTYYLTIELIKRNKKYSNYLFTLIAKLKKL